MSRSISTPPSIKDKVLDTKEAAKALNVSESRVRQFCQAGRLGKKFSGQYFILREELQRFMTEVRTNGRPITKN
jgi:excisionase family DNA binding protein